VVFFFMFRTKKDIDPGTHGIGNATEVADDSKAANAAQFSPDPDAPHPPDPGR